MKRFLSVFAVAALLTGFASCSKDDEPNIPPSSDSEVLEDLFNGNVPVYVEKPETAPVESDGAGAITALEPFVASYPWTVSVTSNTTEAAVRSLGTRAEEASYLVADNENMVGANTTISGSGNGETVTIYLIAPTVVPTEGGIGGTVNLTVKDDSGKEHDFTLYQAYLSSEEIEFNIYPAMVDDLESDNPWLMNGNEIVYSEKPTTTLELISDPMGSWGPQTRFLVDSNRPWIIQGSQNLSITFNPNYGNAGEEGVLGFINTDLQPIQDTDVTVTFIKNDEAPYATTLGTVTIPVPGCGNSASLVGQSLAKDAIASTDGYIYNNSWNGWQPTGDESAPIFVNAAYGSQVYFASEGNWVEFLNPIEFSTGDNGELTKYGLQQVGGQFLIEPNSENESRTAYLIAVPANKVEEVGVSEEEAIVNGALNSKLEDYVLSTITQLAYYNDPQAYALVDWTDNASGLGYNRDDYAELSVARPANDAYRDLFKYTWKEVPVAFNLAFYSIEAPVFVQDLAINTEITKAKFYGELPPYYSTEVTPFEWATLEFSNNKLRIVPQYDYPTNSWKIEVPDYITDLSNLVGYVELLNSAGETVTFIQVTLNAENTSPIPGEDTDELIQGAYVQDGLTGGEKTLPLITLQEGDEGYVTGIAGIQQYGIAMGNYTSVRFNKIPEGPNFVWDPADPDVELPEAFSKQGNYFILVPPENGSGKLYASFTGAWLYITYNTEYEEPSTSFELERFTYYDWSNMNNPSVEVDLAKLTASDSQYNSSLDCEAQYYVKIDAAPANGTVYANKEIDSDNMEVTLYSVMVNNENQTSKFEGTTEIDLTWNGENADVFFPYSGDTQVGATAGDYQIVFLLKDTTTNYTVSLRIDVEVE